MIDQQNLFAKDFEAIKAIASIPAILDVVCRTTGMGYATVARVTNDRWIACAVLDNINFGLEAGGELKVETTLCHEVNQSQKTIAIDNAPDDPVYASHHTLAIYGLKSYIAVPINLKDGRFFGTLCAIDPNPAKVNNPETIGMFTLYAELIATHLDNFEAREVLESKLLEQQEIAALREQFIAILGHDLRNPVGAVRNIGQLLNRGVPDEQVKSRFAKILLNSAIRMSGLIDNLMDFAHGRLGDGIPLHVENTSLDQGLLHVIEELQLIHPKTPILTNIECNKGCMVDGKRIAQLFSNLLSNAFTHGETGKPITVTASTNNDSFTLCVANYGLPLTSEQLKAIFEPFRRAGQNQEGLGLGLFISSEIAKAHGGTLYADYLDKQVRFNLLIPITTE